MQIDMYNCIGHNSANTHELEPFDRLFRYAMDNWIYGGNVVGNLEVIDPFARRCMWGTKRNDINPNFLYEYTTHCMDAGEFLCNLQRSSAHIVLLDPPFSNRQSDEEYGTNNLYTNPAYIANINKQAFRILKPNGFLIKCGYNTNSPGAGFELVRVAICNMGASRNDILISLWQKVQTTLNVGL